MAATGTSPTASYNTDTNVVYIFYLSGGNICASVVDMGDGTIKGPYTIAAFTSGTYNGISSTPYETEHFGILFATSTSGTATTAHASVWFSWEWNDNGNDWQWNQNNVCPYIDDIQMAIDGVLELEYKPASIIQGATLLDEQNDHDATITWGTNPVGISTEMSELQFDQSYNESYYYQYLAPGSTDIINPDPEAMTGDVDLVRLRGNPLYPFVQLLSIGGFLNERLAWLGLAWFIVILAMFGVHLGFDTKKDTEKPQHFVLTTITGMGLSILFFTMGIFPWWVLLLMAFGLIGAIIWERQPVI
ncbi:hypothetical protein HWQ67_19405 [Candidatus Magnetobacterium casensis]|uniref:Uncharacterized protein n=1 Tax=Candidatus Magnetobacterium casense TaxID=1455061 RepID=A0ABS6S4F6_9BACT|nr:hypothetical protein [Candidatus Magnetobacterium casensis]